VDLNSYRVAIGRGDGLVARSGDAVIYIADETAGAAPLLAALDAAAAVELPGRALAKALATIALGPDSAQIPPFGLVAPTADGLLLILRGPVTADIESDGRGRRLSGARALTWVDETLAEPIEKITIGGPDGVAAAIGPHTGLRAGVVPAGGFAVQKSDGPVAASEPVAPQSNTSERRGVPVDTPLRAVEREAPPPPTERRGAPASVANNGPLAEERRRAPAPGERLAPAAHPRFGTPPSSPPRQAPGPGPSTPTPAAETAIRRPTVGSLTYGDDAVYPLDRPYVIGRNPLADRLVRDSVASAIVLSDDPQISRVHAYITVSAESVLVRDAGTPGGTFIAAPGASTWTRVGVQPVVLEPGWCLRIGENVLTYQPTGPAQ
jgi:FHA domain